MCGTGECESGWTVVCCRLWSCLGDESYREVGFEEVLVKSGSQME